MFCGDKIHKLLQSKSISWLNSYTTLLGRKHLCCVISPIIRSGTYWWITVEGGVQPNSCLHTSHTQNLQTKCIRFLVRNNKVQGTSSNQHHQLKTGLYADQKYLGKRFYSDLDCVENVSLLNAQHWGS